MTDRVCPKTGEICTFDERFDLMAEFMPQKRPDIEQVRRSVGMSSREGTCSEGVIIDDTDPVTKIYCSNTNVVTMARVAREKAHERGLDVDLFHNLLMIERI